MNWADTTTRSRLWRRYLDGKPAQDVKPGLREPHQCLPECGSLRRGAPGSPEGRRSGERNEGAPAELRRRGILRRRSPQGHQDGGKNPEKGTGLSPCPGPSCHAHLHWPVTKEGASSTCSGFVNRDWSPVPRSFPSSRSCGKAGKKDEADQTAEPAGLAASGRLRPDPAIAGPEPAGERLFGATMNLGMSVRWIPASAGMTHAKQVSGY